MIKSIPCPIINPISIAIEAIAIKPIWASNRMVKLIAPIVKGIKYSDNSNCKRIILDNIKNLSNVIQDLINDQNKRQMLGKNAKYRAQSELDWKHQIQKYISIINNFNH